MGPCLSDTVDEDNGTVTAFCGCGWSENHPSQEAAEAAARDHQDASDQREAALA
jgi:CDGSH-type Zn-finger protein